MCVGGGGGEHGGEGERSAASRGHATVSTGASERFRVILRARVSANKSCSCVRARTITVTRSAFLTDSLPKKYKQSRT